MAQTVFSRTEKKYLLDAKRFSLLWQRAAPQLCADDWGSYTVQSVYYDTPDALLTRRSIEKPVYKEKLRLRAYGPVEEEDTVYLEIKSKYCGQGSKRRTALPLGIAEQYLAGGEYPLVYDCQILREIEAFRTRYPSLVPFLCIAADRLAFHGKDDDTLRVTIDRNIRWRGENLSLSGKEGGRLLLPKDMVLMEWKAPASLPLWLVRAMSELSVFPVSFSKIGAAYRQAAAASYLYTCAEQERGPVLCSHSKAFC